MIAFWSCITANTRRCMLLVALTVFPSLSTSQTMDGRMQAPILAAVDSSLMDLSVPPGRDFYQFASGAWLSAVSVPAGMGSYSFYDLADRQNERRLIQLCSDDWKPNDTDPLARQLKLFVHSARRQNPEHCLLSLQRYLQEFSKVQSFEDLQSAASAHHLSGGELFFSIHDPLPWENLQGNPLQLWQAKPLFGKQKWPSFGERSEGITSLLLLAGYSPEEASPLVPTVLAIDSSLATKCMTPEEVWSTANTRHLMSAEELAQLLPAWEWQTYFHSLGLNEQQALNIGQPLYFRELEGILSNSGLAELKAYSICCVIHSFSFYCRDTSLACWKKLVTSPADETRSALGEQDFATTCVKRELPEILGELYLQTFFTGEVEDNVREMISHLRRAYKDRLKSRRVLRGAALRHALEKVDAMRFDIGGPVCPSVFAEVEFDSLRLFDNLIHLRSLRRHLLLTSVGTEPDRYRWWVDAYSTNAWYSTSSNRVTLPAGAVLELLHPDSSPATQYAMLGSVLAHEMTHALDSSGLEYHSDGRPKGFLTRAVEAPSRRRFKKSAMRLVDVYSSSVVLDSLYLDGTKELAENLADLGGACISLEGLRQYLASRDTELSIESLQEFFLAYAQKWREVFSDQALRIRASGWHAPPRFRTNLVLMQMDEFYPAFNIQPGDKMYCPREERVQIW